MLRRKVQVLMPKKEKNDITSELGESIQSIILVSGKQRMKK